jgi:signal transduction histidine kinase
MRLLNLPARTLAFRLTVWYSAIFVLSCIVVFLVSYLFLSSSLRNQRDGIEAKARQYSAELQADGIPAFTREVAKDRPTSRRNVFFVRLLDSGNGTIFLSDPRRWRNFDIGSRQSRPEDGEWHYYAATRHGDMLEVLSNQLPDGTILQVGKVIQGREELLQHFRDTIFAVTIPMILIGTAGGAFLAFRALAPVRALSGAVRSIIATGDISARVPETRTEDELNELARLFNQMLARIAALMAGMRQALDDVAHDLRTPMARLRITAESALQPGGDSEKLREALADCLEESEHVTSMLNTLMNISEAETGTMRLNLEPVKVTALIADVLELYRYAAEEKNITVSTVIPEDIVLSADAARMRQVIANILDNAIKYTPNGGRVDIEAAGSRDQVTLSFKDTGIGLSEQEIPRIWDRLYRGDKSRSERGLGLGLSLVKAVVEAHQGRVEARRNPGGGSLFVLHLPNTASHV